MSEEEAEGSSSAETQSEDEEESSSEVSDSDSDYQTRKPRKAATRKTRKPVPLKRPINRRTVAQSSSASDEEDGSTSRESCSGGSDSEDSEGPNNRQKLARRAKEFKRVLRETWRNRIEERGRRKFDKIEEMPEYLNPKNLPDQKLRDYQLEGLNWLLHAWSK